MEHRAHDVERVAVARDALDVRRIGDLERLPMAEDDAYSVLRNGMLSGSRTATYRLPIGSLSEGRWDVL